MKSGLHKQGARTGILKPSLRMIPSPYVHRQIKKVS